MALGRYDKTITATSTGQAVPGAIVTINNKPPNGTGLASLFTDRAGSVSAGNPVTADALGRVRVYLKAARYDVSVTSTSGNTDYEDVEIPKGDLSDIGGSINGNTVTDMNTYLNAQNVASYSVMRANLLSGANVAGDGLYLTGYTGASKTRISGKFTVVTAAGTEFTDDGFGIITASGAASTAGMLVAIRSDPGANIEFIQKTAYADPFSRFMFGMEYSYSLMKLFYDFNGTIIPKMVHSGDSTTAGDAAEGFNPAVVMGYYAENYGVQQVQVNVGHSGAGTVTWESTYVDADILAHPDMSAYFVRWGINDGALHGSTSTYETALRGGLTKLRAFKNLSNLTIILMAPNSTYDEPNNRGEKWYELIAGIIKKAARDFQCVYFDTYAMFRDSYNGANVYLDNPFGDGRGIHPKKEFNTVIYKYLASYLYGALPGLRRNYNRYSSVNSAVFTPVVGVPPVNYHHGRSMFRAQTSKGWPLEGIVVTEKAADNILFQRNIEYNGNRRHFERVGDDQTNGWSGWRQFGTFPLNYSTGWAAFAGFEPLRMHMSGSMVTISGGANYSATNPPDGSIIAVVPADLRPSATVQFLSKTQTGSVFGFCLISVFSSGNVTVTNGGDGALVGIQGSWLAATMI